MSTGQINLNIGAEMVTGPRGLSIKSIILKEVLPNKDNVYNVILEDNSIIGELLIRKGDKGDTGSQGIQGISGVGISNITSIKTELTNQITIHLTNGENKILNVLDGENAYELWLGEENEGTLNDFLEAYRGFKGDKGDKGNTGSQGIQGERGLTGPQGTQGQKGNTGDRGAQGIQGLKGDKGEIGPKGSQGIAGPQGVPGPKGDKGEAGLTEQEIVEKFKNFCPFSVGDIFITTSEINPATRFLGTTWDKLPNDRFLLNSSNPNSAGRTGGSATITEANLPRHRFRVDNHLHTEIPHYHTYQSYGRGGSERFAVIDSYNNGGTYNSSSSGGGNTGGSSPYTNYIGSGQNYWQPWIYVYMWKRLS